MAEQMTILTENNNIVNSNINRDFITTVNA